MRSSVWFFNGFGRLAQAMRSVLIPILPALALLLTAAPAQAATWAIPEPSSMVLFGLGVLGVIIGRHGARRPRE
ncbi:PEP-CTERM sorting domain-containing protein [Tsuneonella aeria]|nr:PEP-CTERM sorting domain-containing protein [Tsuneonella aeria]